MLIRCIFYELLTFLQYTVSFFPLVYKVLSTAELENHDPLIVKRPSQLLGRDAWDYINKFKRNQLFIATSYHSAESPPFVVYSVF